MLMFDITDLTQFGYMIIRLEFRIPIILSVSLAATNNTLPPPPRGKKCLLFSYVHVNMWLFSHSIINLQDDITKNKKPRYDKLYTLIKSAESIVLTIS